MAKGGEQPRASELCRAGLHSARLGARWKTQLAELDEFLRLERRLRAEADPPENEARRLRELHARILADGRALLEPAAIEGIEPRRLARAFAKAFLIASQVRDLLAAEADLLDTAGSGTLRHARSDFFAFPVDSAGARGAPLKAIAELCAKRLRLPVRELDAILADIRARLERVERDRALVRALREEFGLWEGSPGVCEGIARLFAALYPGTGIAPEEVRAVVTGAMVFFALPFEEKGDELTTARYRKLPPAGQAPIRAFLRRLKEFKQEQFANFPAFGFLPEAPRERALLARLGARCGLTAEAAGERLKSLVTILPQARIDKYIVHDVWGHCWQGAMLGYSEAYGAISGFADPLSLYERAESPAGRLVFRACFTGSGDALRLDEERFLAFVRAELGERLPVALAPVLAEMMADILERKFLEDNPSRAELMPSSSRFKEFPTKLDLTLQDLPFYFRQATKVFGLWAKSRRRQERTREQLVGIGASPRAAKAAVARGAALWRELEAERYAPESRWREREDGLEINAFGRLLLNFASIHAAVTDAYGKLDAVDTRGLPVRGLKKLLAIAASVFFEEDRAENLWRIDEFVALRFIPLCERLAGR